MTRFPGTSKRNQSRNRSASRRNESQESQTSILINHEYIIIKKIYMEIKKSDDYGRFIVLKRVHFLNKNQMGVYI